MSKVLAAAKTLYDEARYFPGAGWDTADGRKHADFYMNEARSVLAAVGELRCRVCGGETRLIASLGHDVPYPNVYEHDAPRSPLRLELCETCVLPQLEETVPPAEMFTCYPYRSAQSRTYLDHVRALVERQILPRDAFVVEVGSNDGSLLSHYTDATVLGVDPSDVPASVPTLRAYFNERTAWKILSQSGPAHRIHANNVIAHCPDPHDLFAGFNALLDDSGIVIIESPYIDSLVEGWDTIYQEHVFYWSVTAIDRLALEHGLSIAAVERIPIHGGSMRYYLKRGDFKSSTARTWIAWEQEMSFDHLDARIRAEVRDMHRYPFEGVVCGYGAAAKGGIFRHVCDLDLAFVCDSTPEKQGHTMPGTTIPIVDPVNLADADMAVLLAWNFEDEIRERESWWPGTWVVPHRELVTV